MELAPINQPKKRTMTIAEVARAYGYEPDTIRKKMKELFPESVEHGKLTLIDEEQALTIKKFLTPRTLALKSDVENASTDLEMLERSFEVMAWMKLKIEEKNRIIQNQQQEIKQKDEKIELDAPKVEAHDALMRTEDYMSITAACKHFGVHPKRDIFPFLIQNGYLTQKRLPSQKSLDMDIMSLREAVCQDGKARPQVVVKTNQLDNFRRIIVSKVGLV